MRNSHAVASLIDSTHIYNNTELVSTPTFQPPIESNPSNLPSKFHPSHNIKMHPRGIAGYILRTLELVFGVIVLAMAAALVANQPSGGSPSQINYSVFVGVFSLLTWFYQVIASTISPDGIGGAVVMIIIDSLNLLFYFCGGVAMAVGLRVHSCGNIAFVITNGITDGSTQRCHEAQTLTAFLWFGMTSLYYRNFCSKFGD